MYESDSLGVMLLIRHIFWTCLETWEVATNLVFYYPCMLELWYGGEVMVITKTTSTE